MQWTVTAAKIDGMRCNRLQRLCKFLCFVCAFTMDVSLPHPTVKRRFLVSKSAIEKLVLIYIHRSSCHRPHIYHTRAGTCAHVHLFWLAPSVMFSCHVLLFVMFSLAPYLSYASWYLCACTPFSGWRHLSCSPVTFSFLSCSLWRHIYHKQDWYLCACTPF